MSSSAWKIILLHVIFLDAVESADPCGPGVSISGASTGFVASPNFPNNFGTSQTCVWTITVPSGRIKLSFLNFTLEQGQNTDCTGSNLGGASVTITNIASNDGRSPFTLCGQNIPDPVYSDTNSIQITLRTASNELPGFNASYETVTDEMLCPSGINLTDMSGVITSPFYPRKYPVNQDCFWEISASKGNFVKLDITDMEIHRCGEEGACTCDYLEILDGFLGSGLEPGAVSGKLCVDGSFTPQSYYSTNERLRVRFSSDALLEKQQRGFTATYTMLNYTPPECPSSLIQLSGNGSFSSLNYPLTNYPSGRNCFWNITAPPEKRVKVKIADFQMGNCDDCSADICSRLEFYDGPTADSPSLGRLCTNSLLTAKISSGHQMFVKFYSSFSPDRGFLAEYFETDEVAPSSTSTTRPPLSSSTISLSSPSPSPSPSVPSSSPSSSLSSSPSSSPSPSPKTPEIVNEFKCYDCNEESGEKCTETQRVVNCLTDNTTAMTCWRGYFEKESGKNREMRGCVEGNDCEEDRKRCEAGHNLANLQTAGDDKVKKCSIVCCVSNEDTPCNGVFSVSADMITVIIFIGMLVTFNVL